MQLECTQTFPASVASTFSLLTSEKFYSTLNDFDRIEAPELLEKKETKQQISLRLRYRFIADLPLAALAFVDPDKLIWEQQTMWTKTKPQTANIQFLPVHYKNRLEASATVLLVPDEIKKNTTQRIVNLTLRVHVPLVGKQVEQAIADGLQEYLRYEESQAYELLLKKK